MNYIVGLAAMALGVWQFWQGRSAWKKYKSGKIASKNVWLMYAFAYSFIIGAVFFLLGLAALLGAFGHMNF